MAIILEEGLRQRSKEDAKGWICTSCFHYMSYLPQPGVCANCKHAGTVQRIKTKEESKEQTERMRESQRTPQNQPGQFNHLSWESQLGNPLTSDQVLQIIRKFVPGAVMKPQMNPHLGRALAAYYVPCEPIPQLFLSETETKDKLKFVCCGELGIQPEWDVLPEDAQKRTLTHIRGWRSVLGIFYRNGIIPFLPDDGRRKSWWQIRESKN